MPGPISTWMGDICGRVNHLSIVASHHKHLDTLNLLTSDITIEKLTNFDGVNSFQWMLDNGSGVLNFTLVHLHVTL